MTGGSCLWEIIPLKTSSAKGKTPGRRERKKAVTREELLRAGRRLFAEKGLYESRVEDLTEFAGIAKGTFYRYYDAKEDLVLAVVVDAFAQLQASISARVAGASSMDEVFCGIVESHVAFFAANPDLMRILHQVRGILKFDRREWLPLRRALAGHLTFLGDLLVSESPMRLKRKTSLELAALLFGGVSGALSVRAAVNPRSPLKPALPRLAEALSCSASAYVKRGR